MTFQSCQTFFRCSRRYIVLLESALWPYKSCSKLSKVVMHTRGDSNDIYKGYRYIYPNLLLSLVNFGRFAIVSVQVLLPTGDNSTLMLNANYRNFLKRIPGFSKWFDRYTIKTGDKIAFEDDNIVVSQMPRKVNYKGSNEILVESDRILIEFRRMMRKYQNE